MIKKINLAVIAALLSAGLFAASTSVPFTKGIAISSKASFQEGKEKKKERNKSDHAKREHEKKEQKGKKK